MLKEFKHPGRQYRPIPFWSWNDELQKEELNRQIEEMSTAGLGGYFMHGRSGLKVEYLGKNWCDCIEEGVKKGKETGMHAWIYDDEGWPSGFAGGIVNGMAEAYQAKYMTAEVLQHPKELAREEILGAYSLYGKDSYTFVEDTDFSRFESLLVIRRRVQPYYIDVMSKEAIDAFLKVTHQVYYDRFGEEFGKTMKGFFTDEPRFTCKMGQLPWSDGLREEFHKRYEYDLIEYLPCLFYEYSEFEKVRYDFHRLVNDLFVTNYMKNMYDWCEEHNCYVTGHIMMEETIFSQMSTTGGVMPFYEYEHIPGIDWLRRRIETPVIGKQVSSVASQLGRKQVLTESFALTGWNVSFEELKWIMEWQYVNGVNLLCQHLQAYSLKGSRKRDYPPSLFLQQSWWSEYKNFNDYAGRLGAVLSAGKEEAVFLVLHPMRSGYITFDGTRTERLIALDQEFCKLSTELSALHISYHYGDETIISKYGRIHNNLFQVGEMSYRGVILPTMYTIDEITLKLLLTFLSKGGKVVSIGEFPDYTNGSRKDLEELRNKVIRRKTSDILRYCKDTALQTVSITGTNGEEANIACQIRETGEGTLLFLVNHSQEKTSQVTVTVLGKAGVPLKLIGETGETEGMAYTKGSNTTFELTFEPMQSHLVYLQEEVKTEDVSTCFNTSVILPAGTDWDIKEMGHNSLTLDICTCIIDGNETIGPIPAIKLMKRLLDLKRSCDIELRYEFYVDMDLQNNENLFLCLEDANRYDITVNGEVIDKTQSSYWKDKAFVRLAIKSHVQNGQNVIVLKGRFEQKQKVYDVLYGENVYETELNKLTYDMEIEAVYITGDFGVYSQTAFLPAGRNTVQTEGPFVIKEMPKHFTHTNFTTQGLLFFGETLTITKQIRINKNSEEFRNKNIILHYGKQNAPVVQLFVNGKFVKTSLWAPYKADITSEIIEGENEITFVLYASNRNLLGPHHHTKGECYNVGPSSFTGEWSWVERESEADGTDLGDRSKNYWMDAYSFVAFGLNKDS
ncbi:hypothetical protein acsn021_07890 [Anaerocolumna cellulosilytica]|uniref:Uncharacterized protein n=1 Tax=Anaerocolumna cellulosilytica TaxID=433286 RepID=A0A6S6R1N3_9FIRM|nr:glycosyl hydrolase [Anaerocolumna cellulosilytica]MBB5197647.1 hypothetical protein [Anaerocolumna cellulosilytica]BCJ93220.1 hypothetical protein acsn021_07890 [Anaerocolumna cellulosilytica]